MESGIIRLHLIWRSAKMISTFCFAFVSIIPFLIERQKAVRWWVAVPLARKLGERVRMIIKNMKFHVIKYDWIFYEFWLKVKYTWVFLTNLHDINAQIKENPSIFELFIAWKILIKPKIMPFKLCDYISTLIIKVVREQRCGISTNKRMSELF